MTPMTRVNKTDTARQRIVQPQERKGETLTHRDRGRIRLEGQPTPQLPLLQFRATSDFAVPQNTVFDERIATAQRYDHYLGCFG